MTELPHGIGETLTMLPFDPVWLVRLLVWSIIAACIALWWWLAGRNKRTAPTRRPRRSRTPDRGDESHLSRSVKKLRKSTHKSQDWRAGCHALSALVRTHTEQVTGVPCEEQTVIEIKTSLPDGPFAPFFDRLAAMQFSRAAPSADDFDSVCWDAMELDGKKRRSKRGRSRQRKAG